jgi:hypothetical protein
VGPAEVAELLRPFQQMNSLLVMRSVCSVIRVLRKGGRLAIANLPGTGSLLWRLPRLNGALRTATRWRIAELVREKLVR